MHEKIEAVRHILGSVMPFMLSATSPDSGRPNARSILEAVIIATLTAVATSYVTVQVLKAQVDDLKGYMNQSLMQMETQIARQSTRLDTIILQRNGGK